MERVEAIIVGAGVIGLAIARALALAGREVLILEAESAIGTATSSRNSGVIHAGIYYLPGSLKARLCVAGRDRLYAYAAERAIPHKNCGKFIVATAPDQVDALRKWKANAEANGLTGLRLLPGAEACRMEPELFCVEALHVPMSGIVEQHALMLNLLGDAEEKGAALALQSPVTACAASNDGFTVDVGGVTPMQVGCRILINAAGLGAQSLAKRIKGLDPALVPPLVMAKGNYFTVGGKSPFARLIYPLPVLGSSGLHATLDLGGQTRFGPDVEWVDHVDYRVDPARASLFAESIRRYWPNLPEGALQPDYAGIRPKLARTSPHDSDFLIQTAREHKIPGLVNLFGIESPGLTASMALADEVAKLAVV